MPTNPLIAAFVLAFASYLIGSIPFGLLLVRWIKGVDLRSYGSGNIGATNASRVLGGKWGAVILLLDAAKGLLPTLFLSQYFIDPLGGRHARVLAGTCAILGHVFPVWLRFRGGKGVATALGVASILGWPWAILAATGTFLAVFITTRIVSLGSVLAAAVFAGVKVYELAPLWFEESRWSMTLFSTVIPALIILWHRSNLLRLLRGEERGLTPIPAEPPQQP
ncbi:MAG TPA: glycerol-3-phosphate 1-O-acyltransferase PlsY [Planctomycetaceae bacterium]|nr:glycerol-3-phosphate 1-O-acyltransferase PlsY [Planctomycetaceae bacterium]